MAGDMFRIMETHSLRFYENERDNCHFQPEKRLMIAVLQDAVECFQNCKFEPRNPTNEFLDSEGWIFTNDLKWPFSFINICEAVGMDAGGLRQGLLHWKENTLRSNTLDQSTKPGAKSARGESKARRLPNHGKRRRTIPVGKRAVISKASETQMGLNGAIKYPSIQPTMPAPNRNKERLSQSAMDRWIS
jgi:hypothetical protein